MNRTTEGEVKTSEYMVYDRLSRRTLARVSPLASWQPRGHSQCGLEPELISKKHISTPENQRPKANEETPPGEDMWLVQRSLQTCSFSGQPSSLPEPWFSHVRAYLSHLNHLPHGRFPDLDTGDANFWYLEWGLRTRISNVPARDFSPSTLPLY